MDDFIFWSIKDWTVVGQHCSDGQDLAGALVLLTGQDHLGHHGIAGKLGHSTAKLCQLPHVIQRAQSVQLKMKIDTIWIQMGLKYGIWKVKSCSFQNSTSRPFQIQPNSYHLGFLFTGSILSYSLWLIILNLCARKSMLTNKARLWIQFPF